MPLTNPRHQGNFLPISSKIVNLIKTPQSLCSEKYFDHSAASVSSSLIGGNFVNFVHQRRIGLRADEAQRDVLSSPEEEEEKLVGS